MGDPPSEQPDGDQTLCPICGATLEAFLSPCPCCRGWYCPICGQPAYRDESVFYDAQGKKHSRCSGGLARPRPVWMERRAPVGTPA